MCTASTSPDWRSSSSSVHPEPAPSPLRVRSSASSEFAREASAAMRNTLPFLIKRQCPGWDCVHPRGQISAALVLAMARRIPGGVKGVDVLTSMELYDDFGMKLISPL